MTKCNNAFSYPHPCKAGETKEEKHSSSLAGRGNEEKTVLFSSVPVTRQSGASSTKVAAHLWYFHRGSHCNVCV